MLRARRYVLTMSSAILIAILVACSDGTTEPRNPSTATLVDSLFGAGNTQWFTADSAGAWTMVPTFDEGRVYFERDVTWDGDNIVAPAELVALDRTTGTVIWHSPFISAHNAAIAGNFVGAPWGSMPIFDRFTGEETNHFLYGSTSLSGNAASDGAQFFVGSHDGHVLAINASTGGSNWDTDVGLGHATAFGTAVSGNLVAVTLKHFAASGTDKDSGIVAVVNRQGGGTRWRVVLPDTLRRAGIVEAPIIVGGLVLVATQGHSVFAFDLFSGTPSWSVDASYGHPIDASDGLAACNGQVIVPTGDLGLSALAVSDGHMLWHRSNLGEGSLRGLQCSYGTVIVPAASMRILDASTGADRARYPVLSPIDDGGIWIASAIRDESFLYVGTTRGFAKVKAP